MDMSRAKRWLDAKRRVDELTDELDDAKRARDRAETQLLDAFEREGVKRVSIDGYTVHLRRDVRVAARAGQQAEVVRRLHAVGLDDLVGETYNASQLSAYARDLERVGEKLPAALAEVLNVAELFSIRATRSR